MIWGKVKYQYEHETTKNNHSPVSHYYKLCRPCWPFFTGLLHNYRPQSGFEYCKELSRGMRSGGAVGYTPGVPDLEQPAPLITY